MATKPNTGQQSAAQALGETAQQSTQALESISPTASQLERAAVAAREMSSTTKAMGETIRAESSSSKRALGEMGDRAEQVSRKFRNLSDEMRRGFGPQMLSSFKQAANYLREIEETLVQVGRASSQTFGAGGVGDLYSRTFGREFKELQSAIFNVAKTSKLTVDELRQGYETLARSGVDAARAIELIGKQTGTMDLISQGVLDYNTVLEMTSEALVTLGAHQSEADRMFQGIAHTVTQTTETFGKMILSTHQLSREIATLQQGFRFIGADVERMPQQIVAFSEAAERFREANDRGMTGAVAANLGARLMSNVAQMSPENRIFFGQMAGLGTGVSAGEEMRMLLQGEGGAGRAAEAVLRVLQQQGMGGEFATSQQYAEARDRGDFVGAEAIAQQRLMQAQLLQTFTGVSDPEAMSLLDSLGGGNFEAFADTLKEASMTERELMQKQTQVLEQNRDIAAQYYKTTAQSWKELLEEQKTMRFQSTEGRAALKTILRIDDIIGELQKLPFAMAIAMASGHLLGRGIGWAGKAALAKAGFGGAAATATGGAVATTTAAAQASRMAMIRQGLKTGLRASPASLIGGTSTMARMARFGVRGAGGVVAARSLYQDASDLISHGGRQYSAETIGGQRLEGMGRDIQNIGGAFVAGGPVAGTVAAFATLGMNVTGVVTNMVGLNNSLSRTRNTMEEGTNRLATHISKQFKGSDVASWASRQSAALNTIGQRNVGGFWGRVSGLGSDHTDIRQTYGSATEQERKVLSETFDRMVASWREGEAEQAFAYAQLIRQVAPVGEAFDATIKGLGEVLDKGYLVQDLTFDTMRQVIRDQRERDLEERQHEQEKQEKEERKFEKIAERPIIVNLAAAPITLDGNRIGSIVGQHLLIDGKVQAGPGYTPDR